MTQKRLTKSRSNIVLTGTLGGIGEYFSVDPTILRVIYVILTFATGGGLILLYLLLSWIIPSGRDDHYRGPDSNMNRGRQARGQFFSNGSQNTHSGRKSAEKADDDDDEWSDF